MEMRVNTIHNGMLRWFIAGVEEFSNIRGSLRGEKSVVVDDMTLWDQCFEIFKNGDFLYLFKSWKNCTNFMNGSSWTAVGKVAEKVVIRRWGQIHKLVVQP